MYKMDIIDIYQILHPKIQNVSSVQVDGSFTEIDHIQDHTENFNKNQNNTN